MEHHWVTSMEYYHDYLQFNLTVAYYQIGNTIYSRLSSLRNKAILLHILLRPLYNSSVGGLDSEGPQHCTCILESLPYYVCVIKNNIFS